MTHRDYSAMRSLLLDIVNRSDLTNTICGRDVSPEVVLSRKDLEDIRHVLETA